MEDILMEDIKKQITDTAFHGTACLDPRCKGAMLILVGFVSYFLGGELVSFALLLLLAVFISCGDGAGWAVKMVLAYLVIAYLNAFLRYVEIPILSVIMSIFGVTLLKLVPIVLIGTWILRTTYMDDLMVALQRMRLPQSVTIPLLVMFRYIPTLRIEYRMIRNTMSIRGLCDTFLKRILHPVATMEYILIPLLMRCLKVTDELAASGTTRGLELEGRRYGLDRVVFSGKEILVTAGTIGVLTALLVLDQTSLGKFVLWRV